MSLDKEGLIEVRRIFQEHHPKLEVPSRVALQLSHFWDDDSEIQLEPSS
jgi:hypothetical protein